MRWPAAPWSRERTLRMVWTVETDRSRLRLVGTAHAFPYRFRRSLRALLRTVDRVAFEGPLDAASLERIAEHGRDAAGAPRLADHLSTEAMTEISRRLDARMRHDGRVRAFDLPEPGRASFEMYTEGQRPWMAFFSVWWTCLGWRESVDGDGYRVATRLGREIRPIETLEEQIAVLDGIPIERMVRQLEDVGRWRENAARYVRCYLAGDLDGLMGLMRWYDRRPRGCPSERDRRQYDRIRALLDEGDLVAFVGFPHVPGLLALFEEAGARVTPGAR